MLIGSKERNDYLLTKEVSLAALWTYRYSIGFDSGNTTIQVKIHGGDKHIIRERVYFDPCAFTVGERREA